jgi:hypothetical protein
VIDVEIFSFAISPQKMKKREEQKMKNFTHQVVVVNRIRILSPLYRT